MLLWFAACAGGTSVAIDNRAGQRIDSLSVEAAGQTEDCGAIDPEQSCRVRIAPARDGSFTLSGRLADGTSVQATGLGYTTPGDPVAHAFDVGVGGQVTVKR